MNLIELFQPNFAGRADMPAITFEDRTLTFGELDERSAILAAALRDRLGLVKGDRAAMYLANGHDLVLFYLACLRLGAIVVPLNLLYRDQELSSQLADAEPKVLLTDEPRLEIFQPLHRQFASLDHVLLAGQSAAGDTIAFDAVLDHATAAPVPVHDVKGDDPALMIYTSGTTGRSKGAVLTHHNLTSNIVALLHSWQWTSQDRFVLALPLFHVHGLCNGLHGALASGCTTILFQRFKAEPVLRTLCAQPGTLFFGVPTMYERLLEAAAAGAPVPSSMRLYVSGSAPLSQDTFDRFRNVFGHEILERYGMSETLMITSNLHAGPRGRGTVGKPLPDVCVRVVMDDASVAQAPGEAGEIQVKGPNVLKCYWNEPKKTAESFDEGWFRTGDLGQWDNQGRLVICGRLKELIISGGFNVYPQELNNCLCDHEQIAEAAVIGVPDKLRGELVKAYVVRMDERLDADAVIDHCRDRLATFKVPRSVVFLNKLPRNAMGKLQLQRLPERDRL